LCVCVEFALVYDVCVPIQRETLLRVIQTAEKDPNPPPRVVDVVPMMEETSKPNRDKSLSIEMVDWNVICSPKLRLLL
jgi:hypothetical protein